MTKIMIADDEPDIRDLVAFTLRFAGYDVSAFNNGAEVVEAAPLEMPDLILMDVRMPQMTGYEACKALKEDERVAQIPVVFLSAKGQESEIMTGLSLGAVDYLLKPFAPDDLMKRVKELLIQFGKA